LVSLDTLNRMLINWSLAVPIEHVVASSVFGLLASAAILWILLKTGLAWHLATDIPNERSLHERPTPRVGGWGIVPATIVAMFVAAPHLWLVIVCTLFLAAVSQVDDRRGLPARVRFVAHLAAVAAIVTVYPADVPWWWVVALSILLIWLINLYNFMDGADGLAGGMALFGFAGYALAALISPKPSADLALASAAIAGAAAGFLLFNFYPARIFLGDAGSIPLGFLAGALGYLGWRADVWPIWFPAMAFAPFIADASVTLARRLARGEKFWQAHREHYYQRMVRLGMGHAKTALCWYVVMLAGIMLALWALSRPIAIQWGVVVVWAVVLMLIAAAIDFRWRCFQAGKSSRAEG
jgi:UDP-N-acetylmuramyl pentapeptide phosphotransferase/UDP-N-acetylglucosamine-1-phosphate transferase